MTVWLLALLFSVLIPVIMIILGGVLRKTPPKQVNFFYGYRTTASMKNAATWEFANRHCGNTFFKVGFVTLVGSVLFMLCFIGQKDDLVGMVSLALNLVQVVVIIACIFPTEAALKENFDKDGNPKQNIAE